MTGQAVSMLDSYHPAVAGAGACGVVLVSTL